MLLLLAFLSICYAQFNEHTTRVAFYDWQNKYNKYYLSFAEHTHRYHVFRDNYRFVHTWDAEKAGFSVALNEYADLTSKEFVAHFNGLNISRSPSRADQVPVDDGVPSSWDWRDHGAVTPVKNQQQCGSCWSFSATGSTEGAHFLKTKNLVSLSEQNLIDCSTSEGNEGCNGGLMDQAFQYIIHNKGIDTEKSYPYSASGPNNCKYNSENKAATLSAYDDVKSGDESDLLNALAKTPVSVAIDASQQSFQFYSHGVYYEPACSSTSLDHGVLAVGWGSEGESEFWWVKNSWGADWGDKGYIKMARNRENNCGIATAASYPIV